MSKPIGITRLMRAGDVGTVEGYGVYPPNTVMLVVRLEDGAAVGHVASLRFYELTKGLKIAYAGKGELHIVPGQVPENLSIRIDRPSAAGPQVLPGPGQTSWALGNYDGPVFTRATVAAQEAQATPKP